MKMHKLFKEVAIIKETDKAVCVAKKEYSDDQKQEINEMENKMSAVYWGMGERHFGRSFREKDFWLPKTQVEIKDGKVIGITKWLYNKNKRFVDFPCELKEIADYYINLEKKEKGEQK